MGSLAWIYVKEYGPIHGRAAVWRASGGKATRDEDPTISDATKAMSHGHEAMREHTLQVKARATVGRTEAKRERKEICALRDMMLAIIGGTAPAPAPRPKKPQQRQKRKQAAATRVEKRALELERGLTRLAARWGARLVQK